MSDMGAGRERSGRTCIRDVVLPTEHGAWSYVLEPLALGTLSAFSFKGLLISISVLFGFLAIRPTEIWFSDRSKGQKFARTSMARSAASVFIVVAVMTFIAGGWMAFDRLWPYLLFSAATGAGFFVLHRIHRKSTWREPLAALSVAPFAGVIGLLGGLHNPWVLSVLIALRSVPTLFYVRERLVAERNGSLSLLLGILPSLIAAGVAAVMSLWFAATLLPFCLRAAWGLSRFHWPSRPKAVGLREAAWGALYVLSVAAIVRLYY